MNYLFNGVSLQNGRNMNMDSLLLKCGKIETKDALLAVICDGVGSLADGAFASGTAVRLLSKWFDGIATTQRIGLKLRDAILDINATIVTEAKQNKMDTASTLSALLLLDHEYFFVHIGDSRIYCCENGAVSVLTSDDVSESGKLTAYIGRKEEIFLQYAEGEATGKTFLVCSDGLYKRMDMGFLTSKIKSLNKRTLKELIEDLPKSVIERGEQDNISLALVKIEG